MKGAQLRPLAEIKRDFFGGGGLGAQPPPPQQGPVYVWFGMFGQIMNLA